MPHSIALALLLLAGARAASPPPVVPEPPFPLMQPCMSCGTAISDGATGGPIVATSFAATKSKALGPSVAARLVYDAARRAFSWQTLPSPGVGRRMNAVVALGGPLDDVCTTGGLDTNILAGGHGRDDAAGDVGSLLASMDCWNATSGAWTARAPMLRARKLHGAAPLGDGRFVVAGGRTLAGASKEAEVYDPATNAWTRIGDLHTPAGTLVAVPNGNGTHAAPHTVYAVGAASTQPWEVLDHATLTWRVLPDAANFGPALPPAVGARWFYGASSVPATGELVSAGGRCKRTNAGHLGLVANVTAVDPATGARRVLAPMRARRWMNAAVATPDGGVLAVGGEAPPTARGTFPALPSVEWIVPPPEA